MSRLLSMCFGGQFASACSLQHGQRRTVSQPHHSAGMSSGPSHRETSARDDQVHAASQATASLTPTTLTNFIQKASVETSSSAWSSTLRTLTNTSLDAASRGLDEPLALIVFEESNKQSDTMLPPNQSGIHFTWTSHFQVQCIWTNNASLQELESGDPAAAAQHITKTANENVALCHVLAGLLKSIDHGQVQPVRTWNIFHEHLPQHRSTALWLQPCIWRTDSGTEFLASLLHTEAILHGVQLEAMTRDHVCLKYIPYCVTATTEDGYICSQNPASCACFGCHTSCCDRGNLMKCSLCGSGNPGSGFLTELFHGHQGLLQTFRRHMEAATHFEVCLQLRSPLLRQWLEVEDGREVWHQVHIARTYDLASGTSSYIISQLDITESVQAKDKVLQLKEQHHSLLKEILPPQVIDTILQRKNQVMQAPHAVRTAKQPSGSSTSTSLSLCESSSTHQGAPAKSHHSSRLAAEANSGCSSSLAHSQASLQPVLPRSRRASSILSCEEGSMHCSPTSLQDASGRIWLTQQDVKNLATNHEEVTILFADIKGFTALSQDLHPSEVMLFLNQLYSMWDEMLDMYGVYKVETIGDSYMVAGGLFSCDAQTGSQQLGGLDPLHAQKVYDFAKAMLESASVLLDPKGQAVQVRIGIHTGPCVSGVVGQRMPRFCLFGDTINTASRMESNCPMPGCIHASEATYKLLAGEPWQATGGVLCKGKGLMQSYFMPVTTYLLGRADDMRLRLQLQQELQKVHHSKPVFEISGSCSYSGTRRSDSLQSQVLTPRKHESAAHGRNECDLELEYVSDLGIRFSLATGDSLDVVSGKNRLQSRMGPLDTQAGGFPCCLTSELGSANPSCHDGLRLAPADVMQESYLVRATLREAAVERSTVSKAEQPCHSMQPWLMAEGRMNPPLRALDQNKQETAIHTWQRTRLSSKGGLDAAPLSADTTSSGIESVKQDGPSSSAGLTIPVFVGPPIWRVNEMCLERCPSDAGIPFTPQHHADKSIVRWSSCHGASSMPALMSSDSFAGKPSDVARRAQRVLAQLHETQPMHLPSAAGMYKDELAGAASAELPRSRRLLSPQASLKSQQLHEVHLGNAEAQMQEDRWSSPELQHLRGANYTPVAHQLSHACDISSVF